MKKIFLTVVLVVGITAYYAATAIAEPKDMVSVEVSSAQQGPAQVVTPTWSSEPPVLTPEQIENLEYCSEYTHLPGPSLDYQNAEAVAGPEPGTESVLFEDLTRANAGDPKMWSGVSFASLIPGGYRSNVMESSVGVGGKNVFYTGNWFAARSNTGGATLADWQYMNPYADFPSFCCDQVAIYDPSHDTYFWLRMGSADANGENEFKLSVSNNGFQTYGTYTFPSLWANEWWDYPHMQLGADYLYITWNVFNKSSNWTRTVMLRFPLQALYEWAGFSYNYYAQSEWFTFVPVSGAHHTMYFASNWPSTVPQNSRIRIWRWHEDSGSLTYWTKTVAAWTVTGRNDCHCGPAGGSNWTGRSDMRLLTGARYSVSTDGIAEPRILGRKVLAWWWNVAEGQGFSYPYIDAAAFYEDDMTQVAGYLGRPYVYGSWCFAYPSVTPNARQDMGMVFNYATDPDWAPNVGYAMADDYIHAPPGWIVYNAVSSNALPADNKWGDYNTVRPHAPAGDVWAAAGHFIQQSTDCTNCSKPVYFLFGRLRDKNSLSRWYNK